MLIKESHYSILRPHMATFFTSLMKAQVSIMVKLVKLRQNQSINKTFLLVTATALKTQVNINQSMTEKDMISETQTWRKKILSLS